MHNLSVRSRRPELMDDISRPFTELSTVLRALAKMNFLSLSVLQISEAIVHAVGPIQRPVKLLDLGSGGGDILCGITRHLEKRGLRIDAIGVDINPNTVEYAREQARLRGCNARFHVSTAIEAAQNFEYDIALSSLFLHHLSEEDIVTLLASVKERATLGLVMIDLKRSSMGYGLTWLATHLLSRSWIVRHDGLASVEGALTRQEFQELVIRAGLENCNVFPAYPFRSMLTWKRQI